MTLHQFWDEQGCLLMNPYDIGTGAGTMNPMTTLRTLGPEAVSYTHLTLPTKA